MAEFVDTIVVPITYISKSELEITIQNINAFIERNKNIVIVINNTKPTKVKIAEIALSSVFPELKILEVSQSEYVTRLADYGQTVFEIFDANTAGDGKRLAKKVIPQFKELFENI